MLLVSTRQYDFLSKVTVDLNIYHSSKRLKVYKLFILLFKINVSTKWRAKTPQQRFPLRSPCSDLVCNESGDQQLNLLNRNRQGSKLYIKWFQYVILFFSMHLKVWTWLHSCAKLQLKTASLRTSILIRKKKLPIELKVFLGIQTSESVCVFYPNWKDLLLLNVLSSLSFLPIYSAETVYKFLFVILKSAKVSLSLCFTTSKQDRRLSQMLHLICQSRPYIMYSRPCRISVNNFENVMSTK